MWRYHTLWIHRLPSIHSRHGNSFRRATFLRQGHGRRFIKLLWRSHVSCWQATTHFCTRCSYPLEELQCLWEVPSCSLFCCLRRAVVILFFVSFDDLLHLALTKSCNMSPTDDQWTQASLPVWSGGLGVRSVSMLASLAFLASAAGTLPLQSHSLQNTQAAVEDTSTSLKHWFSVSGISDEASVPVDNQRTSDSIVVNHAFQTLLGAQTDKYHGARLLAAKAAYSGDCLHAEPISLCGFRLKNEAMRVAFGLRLGSALCQPYKCICVASVDTRGSEALSCRRNPGRSQRHHFVNDLI